MESSTFCMRGAAVFTNAAAHAEHPFPVVLSRFARLDRLSAERPREPQARFLKGIALSDQGRTDDAIALFRALLADFPELPEPRNNLAVLYAQKGEYALARDELERAVQTAPDYAVAHENLGDVYARLAQLEYERAVTLDKRNQSASSKLKQIREVPLAK